MRFTVQWWESDGIHEEKRAILDDALARGEAIWDSGKAKTVSVLIDKTTLVWKQPID